jgi:arginine/serine-rich splicing 11
VPTPNPFTQIGALPLAALGVPTVCPALAVLGISGANLSSQALATDQYLKLVNTMDPCSSRSCFTKSETRHK